MGYIQDMRRMIGHERLMPVMRAFAAHVRDVNMPKRNGADGKNMRRRCG